MIKENLIKAIQEVKKSSKKRNFAQTYDLVFSLRGIDLKKTPIDFFTQLVHSRKKPVNICALVGPEMTRKTKEVFKILKSEKVDYSFFEFWSDGI